MKLKLEYDLAEKLALVLKYYDVPGLGKQWATARGPCQDLRMVYVLVKYWGMMIELLV